MEHINLLMNENRLKTHPTNRMKFLIVVRIVKIVEIRSYSCKCFPNLVINDYMSHVVSHRVVAFWLISIGEYWKINL